MNIKNEDKYGRAKEFSGWSGAVIEHSMSLDEYKETGRRKYQEAQKCIGCTHNVEGFCKRYKSFCSNARIACNSLKYYPTSIRN